MATKKRGVLTGKKDIEDNDIRIGDIVEDIKTGKQYIVNKYGNLFSETLGTRQLKGADVKLVGSVGEAQPISTPSEAEILGTPSEDRGLETAYEEEQKEPEKADEFDIDAFLEEQKVLERLEDKYLANELRRRGYTVTAEKTVTTVIKL